MSYKKIINVLLFATALLLVPITASFFADGWNWDTKGYVAAWVVFALAGFGYTFVASFGNSIAYKAGAGLGVLGVFLLIWVIPAVGIVGSEDNSANGMYLGVFVVGLLGMIISRLKPAGMAITMFAVAAVQMLVPTIALLFWNTNVTIGEEPFWGNVGAFRVFIFNAVFAALWLGSALLFRRARAPSTQM